MRGTLNRVPFYFALFLKKIKNTKYFNILNLNKLFCLNSCINHNDDINSNRNLTIGMAIADS